MTTASLSDCVFCTDAHIYDDSLFHPTSRFYQTVKDARVLILSEWWDPWKAPWAQIQATESWAAFQQFTHERADRGLQTIYIPGNHDTPFRKEWAPYATVTNKWVEEYPDCIYEFHHGWERDFIWGGLGKIPGIAPLAFWIADHLPSLMVPIHTRLFGPTPGTEKPSEAVMDFMARHYLLSPAAISAGVDVLNQDWNLHVGTIHTLWREYAVKTGRRVILGHSHCLWDFDGLIADGGAFYEDKAYLAIDGEKIEIVEIGG